MSREEPINFSLTTADHILDATDQVLYKANRLLKNIYKIGPSQKSFENTLLPLDDMGNIIENVWSPVSLLAFTHPDKGIRDAGLKASQKIEEFLNSISVDEKLYNAIDIFSKKINGKVLTGLEKKFLVETLRDFNRSGFGYSERVRNRVKTILDKSTSLGLAFEKNISESKNNTLDFF